MFLFTPFLFQQGNFLIAVLINHFVLPFYPNLDHRQPLDTNSHADGVHRNTPHLLDVICTWKGHYKLFSCDVSSNIMMDILIHILENRPMPDYWPHFEHSHLIKLGKQLSGSVYLVLKTPGEILQEPVGGKHSLLVHSSPKQRNENLALLKSFLY